ncbi:hypothetical protein HELRODRAFT_73751, partial [Helobdella robusta]|uniref:Signal peptidase complex subunit 2 n=1 Tax=Helobdella robusta TaxID=6412 RepID=T1G1I0_HELRO
EEKPVKIDKWDGSALKNALDDHTKKIFKEKFGYVESFRLMDGRLILCTISVVFALFAFAWDYIYPFPKSRDVLIICIYYTYFVMMLVLTIYMTYIEKGCFMLALEKDKTMLDPDNIWKLTSKLKRFDDKYELHISYTNGISKKNKSGHFVKSVCNFFDEEGQLCENSFEKEVLNLHASLSPNKKEN